MTYEELKKQRDELFAALEALVEWDAVMNDGDAPAWDQARRAINRATSRNYCEDFTYLHDTREPDAIAICVHCDVSHRMDEAHTCADEEVIRAVADGKLLFEEPGAGKNAALVCREHGGTFDDNPGKDICKTCEDWLVTDGGA